MIVPYDVKKEQVVEEMGPIKIQTGCVFPHPDNPEKSIISFLEQLNLRFVPNFALKSLLKKEVQGKM